MYVLTVECNNLVTTAWYDFRINLVLIGWALLLIYILHAYSCEENAITAVSMPCWVK